MGLFPTYTPPAQKAAQGYIQQLGNVGNAQAGLATAAGNNYATDNGTYRSDLGGYEDFLRRGTGQQAIDAATGRATANVANNFTAGESNLTSDLAGRGFGMGGGIVGGLSHLEAARAGALSTAATTAATNAQDQDYQRRGTLDNLESGVAGTDYGRQTQALGAEGNIDSGLITDNEQLAQQQAAQHQNWLQQIQGLVATGAQIYGATQGIPPMGGGGGTDAGLGPGTVSDANYYRINPNGSSGYLSH